MSDDVILIVDDETNVLSSLSRTLFEEDLGEVFTAKDGNEALQIIKDKGVPNTIISDYHMPGMNGIDLLAKIREIAPDTTRILLTGAADLDMALNAVNKGNIFRFLVKPCPTDVFISSIKDALRYNQLILGERELLSKTLNGSIKVMIDILEVQSPFIFTQAARLRKLAHELAIALNLESQAWEIELAALLSQIGAVTIPQDTLYKHLKGSQLSESEREMIASIPRMGRQLIKNIPRLELVAEAVGNQNCTYITQIEPDAPIGKNIPIISRILIIILDYDRLRGITHSPLAAINAMQSNELEYDPIFLNIFCTKVLNIDENSTLIATRPKMGERQIYVDDLKVGMVLARDIMDKKGILIVAKDTVMSEVLIYKLINFFRSQAITSPIFIEAD